MNLDPWQLEVLEHDGNIALRSGRQVGKSTIISQKSANFALTHPRTLTLIISAVERQAQLLFEKTLGYLSDTAKKEICTGKNRPTKHIINLKNGSRIMCLPTGMSGYGIRGYTVDLLIADEAAFIPEDVWMAVTPMLSVTKGKIILLSTPHGKEGFYYDCFKDPNFRTWHISSEECPRISKEWLAREKSSKTKAVYAQEYLGEFVDELRQLFSTELIRSCMTLQGSTSTTLPLALQGDNYCGVDVARLGTDQTVIFSLARSEDRERLTQIDMQITEKTYTPDTVRLIKQLDNQFHYKKIYIDTGGLGVAVFDPLLEDPQTKRKVVSIDNSRRSLDKEDKTHTRLLKEDLYMNLLHLMESHKIDLVEDPEILQSLRSVQYEYEDKGAIKIFGNYTHIAESLIRAAWCMKDKALNLWAA